MGNSPLLTRAVPSVAFCEPLPHPRCYCFKEIVSLVVPASECEVEVFPTRRARERVYQFVRNGFVEVGSGYVHGKQYLLSVPVCAAWEVGIGKEGDSVQFRDRKYPHGGGVVQIGGDVAGALLYVENEGGKHLITLVCLHGRWRIETLQYYSPP